MAINTRHIFISLYWKAASGFAIIFLALIGVLTYFNAEQLKDQQNDHRADHQQHYITEFHGLLKKSARQLTNLIDSLPKLKSDSNQLKSKIQRHWPSLQMTWGLESAVLLDQAGKIIQHWGDQRISPRPITIEKAITRGMPIQEMICHETCQLSVVSPILNAAGEIQLVQLSVSLADTMLDFQHITGSDIGILTVAPTMHKGNALLGKTGLTLSALTNRQSLLPIIKRFAREQDWQKNFLAAGEKTVFILDRLFSQYELLFLATPELVSNNAVVVFISDTSFERLQIERAQRIYITAGLLATFVSLALIVLVLWRPIRSLQRQSQALPLLPQGKYKEARQRLTKMAKNRLFADEISQLQETSLQVTEQLESYHQQLTRNSQKLYDMAHLDGLTGLSNRSYLTELINEKLTSQNNKEQHIALIYLDLDNFKHINDALGHSIGDQLLVVVATRLLGCISPEDYAARTGGDEFCLVLNRTDYEVQATETAERVLKALEAPISIDGRSLAVSSSIGITLSPLDGNTAATLLQNADLAMYQAKAKGKNNYHVFNHQLHKDADSLVALEEELRRAVQQQEFVLHYQPQINLKTGELIGCEALIRWQHPERGLLAPFFFIDALENNGLIIPVGKWVIQEACRQCGQWSRMGLGHIKLSINLSTRQFSDPDLLNDIKRAITEAGITPSQLELEVTESLLATDIKHAISVLKDLQNLGITIAIDDFGTGYSSFSYLKQLPLNKLKVDRAFVKDIPGNNDDQQIASAIVAMAHSLNLTVTAEGIETEAQSNYFKEIQCEYGQGYLYDKPLSPEDFVHSALVSRAITADSTQV